MGEDSKKTCEIGFNFENLPHLAVAEIFSYFTFSQIVALKCVNCWFKKTSTRILNSSFLSLRRNLAKLIKATETVLKEDTSLQREAPALMKFKILQILNSELSVLYAVCGKYVKWDIYSFSGGRILDLFNTIMHMKISWPVKTIESYATMRLFLLNQEFMDHFEDNIEQSIIDYPVLHGIKLVDLLDCYCNSNYRLEAKFDGEVCFLSGNYEIRNPQLTFNHFPHLQNNLDTMSSKELQSIIAYVRNEIRWNNLIYYMDSKYSSFFSPIRKARKFCLNSFNSSGKEKVADINNNRNGFIFHKLFSRTFRAAEAREIVSYTIETRCSKSFAPVRLDGHINCQSLTLVDNEVLLNLPDCNYDFGLSIKASFPSVAEGFLSESYLEIYFNNGKYIGQEKMQEVPMQTE